MNFQSEMEPDCRYRLNLEWSVEYNIDFLESLHSFRTRVTSESKIFTIRIPENNVMAHNTVCYLYNQHRNFNNISYVEQPYYTKLSSNK